MVCCVLGLELFFVCFLWVGLLFETLVCWCLGVGLLTIGCGFDLVICG